MSEKFDRRRFDVCCPETGCGAEMEKREDEAGVFWHCRSCGIDWDDEDLD